MPTVESANETLTRWAKAFPTTAPDAFATSAKLGCDAEGQPVVLFNFCYAGSEQEAKALIEPFMAEMKTKPIMNSLKKRDYIQQQRNVGLG